MLLRGSEYFVVSNYRRQRVNDRPLGCKAETTMHPDSLNSMSKTNEIIAEATYGTQTFRRLCIFQYSSIICLLYSEGDDVVQSESKELHEDVCASDKKEHVWAVGLGMPS